MQKCGHEYGMDFDVRTRKALHSLVSGKNVQQGNVSYNAGIEDFFSAR